MKTLVLGTLFAVLLAFGTFAQAPTVPSPPRAAAKDFAPASAKPDSLTELEQVKLENIQLQSQLARVLAEKSDCEGQLGPLRAQTHAKGIQAQIDALKASIEQRSGMAWDPATGRFTPKPSAKNAEVPASK